MNYVIFPSELGFGFFQGYRSNELGRELVVNSWFTNLMKSPINSFVITGFEVSGDEIEDNILHVSPGKCVIAGQSVEITDSNQITSFSTSGELFLFAKVEVTVYDQAESLRFLLNTSGSHSLNSVCLAKIFYGDDNRVSDVQHAAKTPRVIRGTYIGTDSQAKIFLGFKPKVVTIWDSADSQWQWIQEPDHEKSSGIFDSLLPSGDNISAEPERDVDFDENHILVDHHASINGREYEYMVLA